MAIIILYYLKEFFFVLHKLVHFIHESNMSFILDEDQLSEDYSYPFTEHRENERKKKRKLTFIRTESESEQGKVNLSAKKRTR